MRKYHKNVNGHRCKCPWGSVNNDPYVSGRDREVFGSAKESMWHEAAKLDWLMDRPDMQTPEAQDFLNDLSVHFPKHDPLYPWMVREWRKQRLFPSAHSYVTSGTQNYPFSYIDDNGTKQGLEDADLEMLQNWMKYKKQAKSGVDIMQHPISHVLPEASRWDAGGELVHEDYDHNIYHLRNKRDLRVEGRRMNHCIGSNGMSYINNLEDGSGLYYSVRDKSNNPLGTLELERTEDEYHKCPKCNKFGLINFSGTIENEEQAANTGMPLGTELYRCRECGEESPEEQFQSFPVDLRKMAKKPDARFTRAAQFYGENDGGIPSDAVGAMNNWLSDHGHDYVEPDAENEEEREPESLEDGGYQDEYYYEPPETLDELISLYNDGEHEWAPEDYSSACAFAEEHGLEYPSLYRSGAIDYDKIIDNIGSKDGKVDPVEVKQLFEIANEWGDEDNLREASENWLRDQYKFYLDPYGQSNGPGFMGNENTIGPDRLDAGQEDASSPFAGDPAKYVHLPSQHYPDIPKFQHEEYVARNLQHQLEKHYPTNPLDGEELYPSDAPKMNWWDEAPYGTKMQPVKENDYGNPTEFRAPYMPPKFKEDGNVWEDMEAGKPYTPPGGSTFSELPYGRDPVEGERPPVYPHVDHREHLRRRRRDDQPRLPLDDPDWRDVDYKYQPHPDVKTDRDLQNEEKPFKPLGPHIHDPEIGPDIQFGKDDISRQRPFPGMEWENGKGNTQVPYDPNNLENYQKNELQGNLMPVGWYHDRRTQRTMKRPSDLPEHLFQPDNFHLLQMQPGSQPENVPGQTSLWDHENQDSGRYYDPQQGNINTLNTPPTVEQRLMVQSPDEERWRQQDPEGYQIGEEWRNRPRGPWIAKQAGEWTDYEQAQQAQQQQVPQAHQGIGYNNNTIMQFNPERFNGEVFTMPGFEWRIPMLYHHPTGKTFIGREGMEHGDLARQFGLPAPWNEARDPNHEMQPGFIDLHGGRGMGQVNGDAGSHQFYGDWQHPNPDELHQWVSDQYGLNPKPAQKPNFDELELWSSYHPRQDDEWVDEDVPDFSATIPEPRWKRD